MNGDGDLVAHFEARQIHQRIIKHQPLGISDFCDRFGHDVKLSFT